MLTAPDGAALRVAVPRGVSSRPVTLWHDTLPAADAGEDAADWLGRALGVACRLVYQADMAARPVEAAYARPGDVVNLSDGFPVLLACMESLADLNCRLAVPVEMARFRPNLVVTGATAWAEDGWRRLRIGSTVLRVAKPCDRCVMSTIDQATGERPDPEEPLRTLQIFRRDGRGRVLFGQNLVPEREGTIRVGDGVVVE